MRAASRPLWRLLSPDRKTLAHQWAPVSIADQVHAVVRPGQQCLGQRRENRDREFSTGFLLYDGNAVVRNVLPAHPCNVADPPFDRCTTAAHRRAFGAFLAAIAPRTL